MSAELLVVAGEASGDRAAATVLAQLPNVRAFGFGGAALASVDVELLADLRNTTALGFSEVALRAYEVARAFAVLHHACKRRRPRAALLVNYTEFNTRLAHLLWARGTRVLWYGAPQIWAWRSQRAKSLRRHVDRMAVMLPFEESLWRIVGVDAHYVGHPALETPLEDGKVVRERLGMTSQAWTAAILPGSRPHEVRTLLLPMLDAYERVRKDYASVDARLILAPSLGPDVQAWARTMAQKFQVEVLCADAYAGIGPLLPAFDAALCASGTASLECALARVVPVVCYRVGWATELGARALLKTPYVALPNILLGRMAFPELLQRRATATLMAEELARTFEQRASLLSACAEVETVLTVSGHRNASRTVASMIEPWLEPHA
jgi:lipid-A-disaccharide synthase